MTLSDVIFQWAMSMSHPKKGHQITKKIIKIAQNGLSVILFDTEHEYDTLRCHMSSLSHAIPEKWCQITKYFAQNRYISVVFDAEHEYAPHGCHIPGMNHDTLKIGCVIRVHNPSP